MHGCTHTYTHTHITHTQHLWCPENRTALNEVREARIHSHACMHGMHANSHTFPLTDVRACTHASSHTHVRACIHACTHTYVRTYILPDQVRDARIDAEWQAATNMSYLDYCEQLRQLVRHTYIHCLLYTSDAADE